MNIDSNLSRISNEKKKELFNSSDFFERLDEYISKGFSVSIEEVVSLRLITTIENYPKLGISIDEILLVISENFFVSGEFNYRQIQLLNEFIYSLLIYACEVDINFDQVLIILEKTGDYFLYNCYNDEEEMGEDEINEVRRINKLVLEYFPVLENKYQMISNQESKHLCRKVLLRAFQGMLSDNIITYFLENFSAIYGDLIFEYSLQYVNVDFVRIFFTQGRTIEGQSFNDYRDKSTHGPIKGLIKLVFEFHDPQTAHKFFSPSMPRCGRDVLAVMFEELGEYISDTEILKEFISMTKSIYANNFS